MNAARRRHILLALILAGILLLSCLIPYTLIKLGVFGAKKDAVPQALCDYGELSPVLLGGEVCFPVRSADGALAYVPASEAQDAGGAVFLLTASGEAALPDDFLMRAKEQALEPTNQEKFLFLHFAPLLYLSTRTRGSTRP